MNTIHTSREGFSSLQCDMKAAHTKLPSFPQHPFTPQLDFVSSFQCLHCGNWFLILSHVVPIKHPNLNFFVLAPLIVASFTGAPFCGAGLFPEAIIPCQHIYVSCNHNNKLSESQEKSGSAICQNGLILPLNKTPQRR